LLCVLLALAAGYLYWDYTSHFEYTDDAYIAARQFAIAPEVSGYITAVPVTDNQHVAAGGLVTRIDDRTYHAGRHRAA
jgi:membrane fusion protein (multidrug efflux system)